jgi:hypothetical protein
MVTNELIETAQAIKAIIEMFGPQHRDWFPVWAAIGGALAGGVATYLPSFLLEKRKVDRERDALWESLEAEVRVLLSIVEKRGYREAVAGIVRQMQEEEISSSTFSVRVPAHYSRIYQSNVGRIGILDSLAACHIVEFYHLIDAVVQDVTSGGVIADSGGDIEAFEELLYFIDAAIRVGDEIVGGRRRRNEPVGSI